MIRAKNEQDLLSILRVISSEAVGLSKKMNENADPTIKGFKSQREADRQLYGEIVAEDDEEPLEDEAQEEAPPEESEEESAQPESSGEVGASFDSVVQAVNNLRAGKSLRDSSIKQQAQVYYDKLSEDERTTLLVFLDALSNIIAGQVDGKDAQDPSDPPASINISSEESDDVEPEQDSAPQPQPQDTQAPEDQEPAADEEEDTSPPIKVNESQDLTLLRKKIRRMMLRG